MESEDNLFDWFDIITNNIIYLNNSKNNELDIINNKLDIINNDIINNDIINQDIINQDIINKDIINKDIINQSNKKHIDELLENLNIKYYKLLAKVDKLNEHIDKRPYMTRFKNTLNNIYIDINNFYTKHKNLIIEYGISITKCDFLNNNYYDISNNNISDEYCELTNCINTTKYYLYNCFT